MAPSLFLGIAFSALIQGVVSSPAGTYSSQSGCGNPLPDGVEPDKSVNLTLENSSSGVAQRKYRLHLPPGYTNDDNVPLILSFHGRTQDAEYQEDLSQFSNSSYGFEGIAVYPEGIANDKGTQQWQGDPDAPASINDITFTLELVDFLESTYCIDKSRIYASGKSNGGGFTGLLACDPEATARIAAFAPVSAAIYLDSDNNPPRCNPSRAPLPVMELHGFKDTTIAYTGGSNNRGTANTTDIVQYIDDWAIRNNFEIEQNQTSTLCSGKKKVTRYSWDDVVVHYNYSNVYHDWMSSFPNGDTEKALTCVEAEATRIILEWFGKWTL